MKHLLLFLLILAACRSQHKSNPIDGQWEYEKMEGYNGKPFNLEDSLIHSLDEMQKGLKLFFTKGRFKITQQKNGTVEVVGEQPFELTDDHKSIRIKNHNRPDDIFPVIDLSDAELKINLFDSKQAYLVFRKKN